MIRALQRLIFSGAAFALPLSASAHGSEFLQAKVLLLKDGGARLEVTADYGDNPMIADEAEAKNAITRALLWRDSKEGAMKSPGPPTLEKRSQPDPSSPLPTDPLYNSQQHTLLSGVWTLRPDADSLTFKVPEKSSQSVILWMQHEDQPDEKPRWVMLVSGEESPAIALARPALINLPSWMMPAGIVGISLIAGGMLLRRPRIVSQGA